MNDETEIPFAVVTGASSGIGYELARQFAEHGFDLLVTSETERIDEAAQRLRSLGAQVETVRADLATYEGVESLYERVSAMGRPMAARLASVRAKRRAASARSRTRVISPRAAFCHIMASALVSAWS